MGKDTGSWQHQQCPPHQAPNLNCKSFVPDSGWQNAFTACASPCTGLVSANEAIPGCVDSNPPHFKASLAIEPRGWFYGLARYRQATTRIPVCTPKDSAISTDVYKRNATVNAVSRPVEKKYIVFDHSGNQTRLIFSPATGYPIQCPRFGSPIEVDNGGLGIKWRTKTSPFYEDGQIYFDGLVERMEDQETGEESEMHEDTDELNALLYSDEDDDHECSCEEEISTGHSPSKMTGHMKQEEDASAEEVASSGGGHLKRKRLLDYEYSASSLMDTASSGKPNGSSEYEDDAESCCGESKTHGGEFSSLPTNKRLKREKIRETVNILQNIIPGGKDMDAILVLDEAIQYLRSLKLKAKSLGESL